MPIHAQAKNSSHATILTIQWWQALAKRPARREVVRDRKSDNPKASSLKGQLRLANLHKILEIKLFRSTEQVQKRELPRSWSNLSHPGSCKSARCSLFSVDIKSESTVLRKERGIRWQQIAFHFLGIPTATSSLAPSNEERAREEGFFCGSGALPSLSQMAPEILRSDPRPGADAQKAGRVSVEPGLPSTTGSNHSAHPHPREFRGSRGISPSPS